jgi:RNAse (barnase) inhibitor barstar
MQPFTFTSDIATLQGEGVRVVVVPTDLSDKNALFSWYAETLHFPEYFGNNWDAFDECLCDLSWIKERRLVLYHRRVPLEASLENQRTYIDVLATVVRDWKPHEAHEVVVAFDPVCELRLRAVTRHP